MIKRNIIQKLLRFCILMPVVCASLLFGCEKTPATKTDYGDDDDDTVVPIEVIDGKVRFYLKESAEAARAKFGLSSRSWSQAKVKVNGKTYSTAAAEDGRYYIEVEESSGSTYGAVLTASGSEDWYDYSLESDLRVPHSQFYSTTVKSLSSYPMFATYSEATGNKKGDRKEIVTFRSLYMA